MSKKKEPESSLVAVVGIDQREATRSQRPAGIERMAYFSIDEWLACSDKDKEKYDRVDMTDAAKAAEKKARKNDD